MFGASEKCSKKVSSNSSSQSGGSALCALPVEIQETVSAGCFLQQQESRLLPMKRQETP